VVKPLREIRSRTEAKVLKDRVIRSLGRLDKFELLVSKSMLHHHCRYAEVDFEEQVIIFNPTKNTLEEFPFSVLHELIHVMYHDAQERTVERIEALFRPLVTRRDIEIIMAYTVPRLNWEDWNNGT